MAVFAVAFVLSSNFVEARTTKVVTKSKTTVVHRHENVVSVVAAPQVSAAPQYEFVQPVPVQTYVQVPVYQAAPLAAPVVNAAPMTWGQRRHVYLALRHTRDALRHARKSF